MPFSHSVMCAVKKLTLIEFADVIEICGSDAKTSRCESTASCYCEKKVSKGHACVGKCFTGSAGSGDMCENAEKLD